MDIRNSATLGTIDHTPIVQLANLSPGGNDSVEASVFADTGVLESERIIELTHANYCPLPEYCLIEEKYKYVAG